MLAVGYWSLQNLRSETLETLETLHATLPSSQQRRLVGASQTRVFSLKPHKKNYRFFGDV